MLEQLLLKKLVDTAFSVGKEFLRSSKAQLEMSTDQLEQCIDQHLRVVGGWANEIALSDLRTAKTTSEVYIPLDFYLYPRRQRLDSREIPSRVRLEQLVAAGESHVLILGHPGAGKTTSIKHLCNTMLTSGEDIYPGFAFPLVIRLRELSTRHLGLESDLVQKNQKKLLIGKLQQILGVTVSWPDALKGDDAISERVSTLERLIVQLLESLRPILILEGFDEIGYRTRQDAVLEEIRFLSMSLTAR